MWVFRADVHRYSGTPGDLLSYYFDPSCCLRLEWARMGQGMMDTLGGTRLTIPWAGGVPDLGVFRPAFEMLGEIRAAGRRRIEDSPSSPGRALAQAARRLLASGEVESVLDAAVRLGMPKYDDRRPEADGRAEVAAERRLSRYLARFPEAGGTDV